eukprot:757874-Hanusia_phi.AAC.1
MEESVWRKVGGYRKGSGFLYNHLLHPCSEKLSSCTAQEARGHPQRWDPYGAPSAGNSLPGGLEVELCRRQHASFHYLCPPPSRRCPASRSRPALVPGGPRIRWEASRASGRGRELLRGMRGESNAILPLRGSLGFQPSGMSRRGGGGRKGTSGGSQGWRKRVEAERRTLEEGA